MSRSEPCIDFAARLQQACDHAGVPGGRHRITAVATRFGVARETARLWFTGRVMPELPRLIEIASEYRCSLDWLAMGRGKLSPVEADPAHVSALSTPEHHLLTAIRDLTPQRRAGLIALLCEP